MVAQDQCVLPEGEPTLYDQGHATMPMCLRHVEETFVFLPQGLVLGAPSCRFQRMHLSPVGERS